MRYYLDSMTTVSVNDLFHGLFEWRHQPGSRTEGHLVISQRSRAAATVPCPDTGRPLRVATVEVSDRAVCAACAQPGAGGYVSFVSDLRLAFACPSCLKLVWMAGA